MNVRYSMNDLSNRFLLFSQFFPLSKKISSDFRHVEISDKSINLSLKEHEIEQIRKRTNEMNQYLSISVIIHHETLTKVFLLCSFVLLFYIRSRDHWQIDADSKANNTMETSSSVIFLSLSLSFFLSCFMSDDLSFARISTVIDQLVQRRISISELFLSHAYDDSLGKKHA